VHLVHSESLTAAVQEVYTQFPFLTLALAMVLHVIRLWCQLADGGGAAAGLDPLDAAWRQQHPTVVLARAIATHIFGAVVAPDASMSLGKAASAAASGVANAVRAATVFKRCFTGTSRLRNGHRLDSEAPRLRSRRLGRWSRRFRIRRRLRLGHFAALLAGGARKRGRSALSCGLPVNLSNH